MATDISGIHIMPLTFVLVMLTFLLPSRALDCGKCLHIAEVDNYPVDEACPTYYSECVTDTTGGGAAGGGQGTVSGDPHFVGAQGTRYDFNGLPNKDYCLFTDSSAHVNMHMIGYSLSTNDSERKLEGGKQVRTWIGKLGIVWKVGGKSHSLVLSARKGPQVKRGTGFLAGAELDSVAFPPLQVGETRSLIGGGNLTFHHIGSWGHHKEPVDVYVITLPGLLTIEVALRVEHRRWRTRSNAWTHFDVSLSQVHPSDKLHGVLGQTFRTDRGSRSMDFKSLTSLLRHPVAADGDSGAGFLDGSTADYETSSVLATDCRFSAYKQAE